MQNHIAPEFEYSTSVGNKVLTSTLPDHVIVLHVWPWEIEVNPKGSLVYESIHLN